MLPFPDLSPPFCRSPLDQLGARSSGVLEVPFGRGLVSLCWKLDVDLELCFRAGSQQHRMHRPKYLRAEGGPMGRLHQEIRARVGQVTLPRGFKLPSGLDGKGNTISD